VVAAGAAYGDRSLFGAHPPRRRMPLTLAPSSEAEAVRSMGSRETPGECSENRSECTRTHECGGVRAGRPQAQLSCGITKSRTVCI
jgi:hypothetical protein